MKTVMVFGTFDILHPGHINFLNQAKKHGQLIAVIARNRTVKQVKGKLPQHSEKERLEAIKGLKLADKVIMGSLTDKYAVIRKYRPDVICLGYDQKYFVDELEQELKKLSAKGGSQPKGATISGGNTKIIRLKPYKAHKYKTSILKNSNFN